MSSESPENTAATPARDPEEPAAKPTISGGKAGGIMAISLFLSRLLGLVRDAVIARQFGLQGVNDSYQIAIQIPDLIFMLIAGGGLSSAFIPVFSDLWYTDRRKEAWKAFSVVVTICTVISIALVAIAWALTPMIVNRYSQVPDVVNRAVIMSRIMLPAQIAFLVGSILLATLYSRKQFLGPGLAPNIYNVGIILGAAVLPGIFGFGIIGVAWGALAGAVVGNIVLPIVMMIPQGTKFLPSFDVQAPGVKKFFQLLLPVILGFSLPSMVNLVTQYFASPYGPGSNTVLRYSNNLMQAPLGIFGQSFALGVFPMLSQFVAEKRMDGYRDLLSKTMRTVMYLCIPCCGLMFALAPLVVHVIYAYGKASHDQGQLDLIATCLRIYCVAIPFWCLQPILIRGFFSLHNTLKPVIVGTLATGLFILLCEAVRVNPIGILALPWATNVAAIALVCVLLILLEQEIGKLDRRGMIETFLKSIIASLPVAVAVFYAAKFYEPHSKLLGAAWLLTLSGGFAFFYYWITLRLKMPESHSPFVEKIVRKLTRKPTS